MIARDTKASHLTSQEMMTKRMRAAQFDRYGVARDVLRVIDGLQVPQPGPRELLVRVHASAVNPIDCAVRSGYGAQYFELQTNNRPPMRPGRDLAGEVIACGPHAMDFQVGDAVFAATLGNANSEYAVVPQDWAAPKPRSLSFAEAASLPYVALTTWTALVTHAGLSADTAQRRRVIIPRAAGGVGSFATQLVKAWGGYVAAICSTRNVPLVRSLGADIIIDHKKEDPGSRLHEFDIAFDTSFDTESTLLGALRTGADAVYVSIVSPKLRLIDEFGLQEGLRRGEALLAARVASQRALGRRYYWSFAKPNGSALRTIGELCDCGMIRAVIDRSYSLDQIVEAHEYCESGQAQGKIVVQIAGGEFVTKR